ncbi:hypothetical protein GCM10011495_07180 [Hymenobacter frigidus]|uniref:Uncharacterized protein n=1 Tax=Hymenobacter frigidus TaxID=1524095 RepID=A0ABQ1ZZD4_9BACT|nr:hypothetical protein GCM10011495_07180 [Hymenobacter frigidus]
MFGFAHYIEQALGGKVLAHSCGQAIQDQGHGHAQGLFYAGLSFIHQGAKLGNNIAGKTEIYGFD